MRGYVADVNLMISSDREVLHHLDFFDRCEKSRRPHPPEEVSAYAISEVDIGLGGSGAVMVILNVIIRTKILPPILGPAGNFSFSLA